MFPDKNLEAALRALVFEKKTNTEELTDDDLRKISTLEAKGRKIQNLPAWRSAPTCCCSTCRTTRSRTWRRSAALASLQSLSLAQNKIVDLTPLMDLNKLQYLNLSSNQIRALQPLSAMTKLSALYLAENQIEELAPLGRTGRTVVAGSGQEQDREHQAAGRHRAVFGLEAERQRDRRHLAGHATSAAEHAAGRAQQDRRSGALVAAAKADAEGRKNFAPFLRLYLAGNPLSDAAKNEQLAALKGAGVRIEN